MYSLIGGAGIVGGGVPLLQEMNGKSERLRVLIVEDEGVIARDIQMMLAELGYDVAGVASSGLEALHLSSTMAADLVLMDIKIQGEMDGIDTAEQIRLKFRLPVIYLTAHN